jgi:acyl carrier protein
MFTSTTIPKSPVTDAVLLGLWECSDAKITDVRADMKLKADLGMDSLDLMESVMTIEDTLGIEIEDDLLEKAKTVGDVIAAVETVVKRGAAS